MESAAHIAALREEGERMVAAVAAAGPGDAVPSCPEWSVRDLARHMGGVHRWATGFVRGRTEPLHADLDEVVGTWPDDAELAAWLGRGCADLVDALATAPDDLQCWTFLPAPSPRAMWARRQAHETAIHSVDAHQAAGLPLPQWTPAFAADGVDELLSLFVPRRRTGLRADPPLTLRVTCVDTDASWLLRLDGQGVSTTATTGTDQERADCGVTAEAGALYLALWNRAGGDELVVSGDRDVLDRFSDTVRIRWS